MNPSVNESARNFLKDVVQAVERRLVLRDVLGDVSDSDPEELDMVKVSFNMT